MDCCDSYKGGNRPRCRLFFTKLFALVLFLQIAGSNVAAAACCCADCTPAVNNNTTSIVGKMVQEIGVLKNIFNVVTFFTDSFQRYTGLFRDKLDTLIAVEHVGNYLKAKQDFYIHESWKSFETAKEEQSLIAEQTGKNYWHPKSKADCVTWLTHLNMVKAQGKTQTMADAILKMVEERNIINTGSLTGYSDYFDMLCPPNSNFPKSLPEGSEPIPECKNTTGKFAGLALSMRSLSPNEQKVWPSTKKALGPDGKTTYEVLDPQSDEERRGLAAISYLYFLASNRPLPPKGRELETAEGRMRAVKWSECAARQSGPLKVLADGAAYTMKPNCKKNADIFKQECEAGKKLCEKAASMGVKCKEQLNIDPETGLSPYETEFVKLIVDSSPENAKQIAAAGKEQGEIAKIAQTNSLAWFMWQNKLATLNASMAQAAADLASLNCWPPETGTTRLVSSDGIENNGYRSGRLISGSVNFKGAQQGEELSTLESLKNGQRYSEKRRNNRMQIGVPVFSDEVELVRVLAHE